MLILRLIVFDVLLPFKGEPATVEWRAFPIGA